MARSAIEMLNNPPVRDVSEMPEATTSPFDKAIEMLSYQDGKELELMTRTTPQIADACNVGYNLICRYGSDYIRGRVDMIMRLAVSQKGEGRHEVVDSLKAGAKMMVDAKSRVQPQFIDTEDD